MNFYSLYGLTLASEFTLPDLPAARSGEITVRRGSIDREGMVLDDRGRSLKADDRDIRISWPEVGCFQIRGGKEIVAEPDPGISDDVVALFIVGAAMGLLLHQRGSIALHSSVVSIDGGAAALIGGKGWGKSSLAATFVDHGAKLVTDDIAVVCFEGDDPRVLPGVAQIKLWPDSIEALGKRPEEYPRLHANIEKRVLSFGTSFEGKSVPLRAIFFLDGGERPAVEPVEKTEALRRLMPHWYGARYGLSVLQSLGLESHFRQCAALTRTVDCALLRRARSLASLGEAADLAIEHIRTKTGTCSR